MKLHAILLGLIAFFNVITPAWAIPVNLRDVNTTLPFNADFVTTLNTLTAPRVVTLPQAGNFTGSAIQFYDSNYSISNTNTLSFIVQGSDLLNGSTSPLIINVTGANATFVRSPSGWYASTQNSLSLATNAANAILPTALWNLQSPNLSVAGNIPSNFYGSAKCMWGWNLSGGSGETDFICDKDGGSSGGFWWMDTLSGSNRHLMDLSANNGLSIPYFVNSAAPGPPPPPTGSGGLSVTRSSSGFFDVGISSRCVVFTASFGCNNYLVGETDQGSTLGATGAETEARNWSSVSAGVYTAGTGQPPNITFPAVFDGLHGIFPIAQQSTCSDPDGYGCYVSHLSGRSGLYPAPFLGSFWANTTASSWRGIWISATAADGPVQTALLQNPGNVLMATGSPAVSASGSGYSIGCVIKLADTNATVPVVLTVTAVTPTLTAQLDIPGSTTSQPSNPVAQSGSSSCGGTGATWTMSYALGSVLDLQTMGSQVAANPVLRVLDQSGTVDAQITQGGTITGSAYKAGATAGVSCSGTPTSSFAAVNGIVTHC